MADNEELEIIDEKEPEKKAKTITITLPSFSLPKFNKNKKKKKTEKKKEVSLYEEDGITPVDPSLFENPVTAARAALAEVLSEQEGGDSVNVPEDLHTIPSYGNTAEDAVEITGENAPEAPAREVSYSAIEAFGSSETAEEFASEESFVAAEQEHASAEEIIAQAKGETKAADAPSQPAEDAESNEQAAPMIPDFVQNIPAGEDADYSSEDSDADENAEASSKAKFKKPDIKKPDIKMPDVKGALSKVDWKGIGDTIKRFFLRIGHFIADHKFYFIAGLLLVVAILLVIFGITSRDEEPSTNASGRFAVNKYEDVNALMEKYHTAYANGDVDTILSIADPVSDAEQSYIKFFSDYIEEYRNITVYTKQGLNKGSYLVSVTTDMKFEDVETTAAALEFFYVQTDDEGNLYIDNLYSSFNTSNEELDQDATIKELVQNYENSEEVQELAAQVNESCNASLASDTALDDLINTTLQDAISNWAVDYVAKVEEERIAAQEQAEAEAEEKAKAEQEAQAKAIQEADDADTENVYTNSSNVNVRAEADANSEKLGSLAKDTDLIRYSFSDNGWSKIDYNGQVAYVRSEYLDVRVDESEQENAEDGATDDTYHEGDEIILPNTVNIRKSASETSDKVAVAYVGDKIKVVMCYAEGWTKVKYGNHEGYIKTELLSEEE